jgi:hypothetical protein
MKRREITKKMLNSLPDWKEIERHQRGAMCRLSVKFPEWFAERHPEDAVYTNVDFAINWNPEYVCKQEPERMAEHYPHAMIQYRPEWICHHNPEWVFKHRPDILFKHRPEWMVQNKLKWMSWYRFHWMQENYPMFLEKELPDPDFEEPEWMGELIAKYNENL